MAINFMILGSGLKVASTPITRRQWVAVMGPDTASQTEWERMKWTNSSLECPATFVSAVDAEEFCRRLGCGWRLPTSAEQAEYSYPLHSTFPFSDHVVGYLPYDGGPPPVGTKQPMPNGLLDTHGLVVEWTSDLKLYGSMWHDHPLVFSTADLGWMAHHRYCDAGFRVVQGEK